MPFLEISDFGGTLAARAAAAEGGTAAVVEAFGVSPDIVTCYFHDSANGYAHAGKFGANAEKNRVFVKVHAFQRSYDAQNHAARLVTAAFAKGYGLPADHVAVYFVARDPHDAYHGGIPASDAK